MSRSIEAKKIVGLLVLLMAATVLLSGPVAGVLDLPEPTAQAKKKKKKKKKKNRPPAFNVVQCPTEGEDSFNCDGTSSNDFIVGGPADRPNGAFDQMFGGEGNDVYSGGNGSDILLDFSNTSSDRYHFPATAFSTNPEGESFTVVSDSGGGGDVVVLSSYGITEFEVSRTGFIPDDLLLDGPGGREIVVVDFFDGGNFEGKIETFLFREGLFTADQIGGSAAQATPEDLPAPSERLRERTPSEEAVQQEEASS